MSDTAFEYCNNTEWGRRMISDFRCAKALFRVLCFLSFFEIGLCRTHVVLVALQVLLFLYGCGLSLGLWVLVMMCYCLYVL